MENELKDKEILSTLIQMSKTIECELEQRKIEFEQLIANNDTSTLRQHVKSDIQHFRFILSQHISTFNNFKKQFEIDLMNNNNC